MCPLRYEEEDGYYHNFLGNVEFYMDEPWYNVRDLLRVLRRIRKFDFSHPEHRYIALCWLNGMCCTAPYGLTCRFPCKDFYVTEARGCWGEILSQLKKNLADNCMIKFEIGKEDPPRRKEKNYCAGNTKYCSDIEDVSGPTMVEYCDHGKLDCYAPQCQPQVNNYCPINSNFCDDCLGPEPPSCCPDWRGQCQIKKIPRGAFKTYIKSFNDIIEKMMKGLEKKDWVFSRKSFENHFKVIWTRCKRKCDILENDSDEDCICDYCCREEQAQNSCYN